ncbi:conserved hypothetical protein [Theileria orientalis strain Shintoku]|uniref:Uncharacterized protein n=1 Tax=Theileria orientalis strain Shintoku TaxID=869250 RepID=J4C4H4_THEOR|nr:conserved hypothetical protein [Theileria orientalis strain Shintoku]PVC54645.1 hypothetical protein MACL_00001157 [Theileria orientalis]BAM42191.1 conserved hypothetical protein [Theileria orientalis strain Shintoku]|eukprot:XP_009692492.1 conserved hypothetical protein [Theileria orientalis strain Shintoku]
MSESEEVETKTASDSQDEFVVNESRPKRKVNKSAKNGKNSGKVNSTKAKKGESKPKKAEKPKKEKSVKKTVKRQTKGESRSNKGPAARQAKTPRAAKPRQPKQPKVKEPKPEPVSNFSKQGQRYMTPPPGDGTRGFYESLYEENPNSLIAIKFCVEYGIFGGSKHSEALAKYTILQKNGHFKGAVGAIKPSAITFLQKSQVKSEKS